MLVDMTEMAGYMLTERAIEAFKEKLKELENEEV